MHEFQSALAIGHHAEREVIERCRRRIPTFALIGERNDDSRCDFTATVNGVPLLFEVKHDLMAPTTGRVAIEFQCSGRWSGIYATHAAIYIYRYGDTFRMVKVHDLRDAHRTNQYRTVYGGDGNRARMFLMPVEDFERLGVAL